MKSLRETYSYQYFRSRARTLSWRAPIVCNAIVRAFNPKSVLDVGCAVGDLVKGFMELGIDTMGLEGSPEALPYMMVQADKVYIQDLRGPLDIGKQFELVTCFEVMEHIEPEYENILTANLQSLCSQWLVISAAPPDQGGIGHVNCKPQEYWINEFQKLFLFYRPDLVLRLKQEWLPYKSKPGIKAYYQNLMVFERV